MKVTLIEKHTGKEEVYNNIISIDIEEDGFVYLRYLSEEGWNSSARYNVYKYKINIQGESK